MHGEKSCTAVRTAAADRQTCVNGNATDETCGCCPRLQPGTWLRAIDFGCAQPVQEGVSLTRKTGTPMFMVRQRMGFSVMLHKTQVRLCLRGYVIVTTALSCIV